MDSSEPKKELTGLARSIDELFDEPAGSGVSGEEMVWEEVEEEAPVGPKASDANPDALAQAVADFLESPPLERDGKGSVVRTEAAALREANNLDVLADAVERLATHGEEPDEACVAMGQALLTPGVASRIAARLGTAREDERRAELVELCRRLGHDMVLALSDALSSTNDRFSRRTYLDTMVALGDQAMPVVEQMAEDNKWFVVRNAVAILGEVGGGHAVELIISTLAHQEPKVRREALLSLAKVGGEDAGQLVHGMIQDPDPDVRLAAAMAAGELKVERALRPLLELMEGESDTDVVVGVIRALGQLGDPGAVNAIEKRAVGSFFSRPPAEVRIAAYRALHSIGTPHAKSLLQQAADDKDAEVKAAVRQILGMR